MIFVRSDFIFSVQILCRPFWLFFHSHPFYTLTTDFMYIKMRSFLFPFSLCLHLYATVLEWHQSVNDALITTLFFDATSFYCTFLHHKSSSNFSFLSLSFFAVQSITQRQKSRSFFLMQKTAKCSASCEQWCMVSCCLC